MSSFHPQTPSQSKEDDKPKTRNIGTQRSDSVISNGLGPRKSIAMATSPALLRNNSIGAPPTAGHRNSVTVERQMSRMSLSNGPPARRGVSIFGVVAAARAWKRFSMNRREKIPEKPKIRLENTFRLGPEPENTFKPNLVQNAIKDVMTMYLKNFVYSADGSKSLGMTIASDIKSRVKKMGFSRYKIVCSIVLLQNKGQGAEIASRCVWNEATDSHASYTFTSPAVVAICNVHGVYFD